MTTSAQASIYSQCYAIESEQQSPHARLLFAYDERTNNHIVMKILRDYKDARYSLETIEKRQQCQFEALRWNRIFTPEVYSGLARVRAEKSPGNLEIGKIITHPARKRLGRQADYVLLMQRLPDDRRLDNILANSSVESLEIELRLLTAHVAKIHKALQQRPLVASRASKTWWGGIEQLQEKLEHNLKFFDDALALCTPGQRKTYGKLKDNLLAVLADKRYQKYIEERRNTGKCIKRCHGDLKAPNIWITHYAYSQERTFREPIQILDAIDFNEVYSNIDLLSDFAMLVVDVQARVTSQEQADLMMREYLQATGQQGEAAEAVLTYYLVEKAIICASVSILFDRLPDLAQAFFEIADLYVQKLRSS